MTRVLALSAALLPGWALACPACAQRADGNRFATYLLIAALLAVPYTLGALVIRIVKRLE